MAIYRKGSIFSNSLNENREHGLGSNQAHREAYFSEGSVTSVNGSHINTFDGGICLVKELTICYPEFATRLDVVSRFGSATKYSSTHCLTIISLRARFIPPKSVTSWSVFAYV